mgnify:CR=1 FL=1
MAGGLHNAVIFYSLYHRLEKFKEAVDCCLCQVVDSPAYFGIVKYKKQFPICINPQDCPKIENGMTRVRCVSQLRKLGDIKLRARKWPGVTSEATCKEKRPDPGMCTVISKMETQNSRGMHLLLTKYNI